MGLFDQIVGAIANPNQQASPDQLSSILGMVQQLGGQNGIDPSTSQTVLSMAGEAVRSALQHKQATEGQGRVEAIVDQFSGVGKNPAAVAALFTPDQQQQVANIIAERTGISAAQVQGLLVLAVPIILKMLQTGASTSGQTGGNNVLNVFLDSDNDGDVDIGDAIAMAGRFMQSR